MRIESIEGQTENLSGGTHKIGDDVSTDAASGDTYGVDDVTSLSRVVAGMDLHKSFRPDFQPLFDGVVLAFVWILKLLLIYAIAMTAAAWNSPRACQRLDFRLERIVPVAEVACWLTKK